MVAEAKHATRHAAENGSIADFHKLGVDRGIKEFCRKRRTGFSHEDISRVSMVQASEADGCLDQKCPARMREPDDARRGTLAHAATAGKCE